MSTLEPTCSKLTLHSLYKVSSGYRTAAVLSLTGEIIDNVSNEIQVTEH